MRRKIGLINLLRWLFVVALVLLAGVLSLFQISESYRQFGEQSKAIREKFIGRQKEMVKREVERVVERISQGRAASAGKANKMIMERVYEAHAIAENIYNRQHGVKKRAEVEELIKESLRPIRFNDGSGFYFIIDTQGRNVMCAASCLLEGCNILEHRDHQGRYIIREMLEIVSLKDEGFYHYYWTKPDESGVDHRKLSFIKHFEPYNWIIGSGVYFSDIEKNLQQELLEEIGKIRFGEQKNGYIFVVSYDGVTLMNDTMRHLIGKNIWDLTDPNGVKVIQEERRAVANPAGDFIYYSWNKPSIDKPSPKTSFMKGVDDWQWMIGAGVYLDDCEREIALLHDDLMRELKQVVAGIVVTTLVVILLFLFLLSIVSRYLARDYEIFMRFFSRAADSDEEIKQDELKFKEFDELSGYANRMLREKIESQSKLADEHERLEVTLHSIGDAVITADIEGRVLMLNQVAEKLTGWQQALALARPVSEIFRIINKTTRDSRTCPVNEALEKKEIVELENHTLLLSRDGCEYDVEDSAAPIRDSNRKIIGVVLVFRDVTAKLKSEREIQRSRQLESIGTLAGGIAHDFNNLLTGIFGNISLAKNFLETDNKAFEFLDASEKSIGRATDLTAQLLTFAKGGAPMTKVQAIDEIIKKTAEFSLRGSKIKLHLDIEPGLWSAEVDKGQLSQVISNLVINAQQAMPDKGGNIYLRAENIHNQDTEKLLSSAERLIKISVEDEGCGIPSHLYDKIFDPYFTTRELGNGLGLATCHSIISRHDGLLTFTSETGHGSVFTIYLPAVEKVAILKKSEPFFEKVKFAHSLAEARILIMDDEPHICQLLEQLLERFGAFTSTVDDGSQALSEYQQAFARGEPYDLVIVDLTIPGGMGGQETAEKILQLDPEARIVVSSGYANDPVMARYQDYGFKGRAIKPYQIAELKVELERVLAG
ncbi:MAG: cache domain-containing protein [Pseudomonadota bacterium]|nr:cache domain-containing protein [Pseudomonadota bacterium]